MQNSETHTPIDEQVANLVNTLDMCLREEFEERAGILEFDALQPRNHAESLALIEVLRRHPEVLTGVTVLQIELDGETQWLLTSDLGFARRHLADIGGIEREVLTLSEVIHEQYGGVALLTTLG
jgi:hypothetical protein